MPDGTILTLEKITYGVVHKFEFEVEERGSTFFGLLPTRRTRQRTVTTSTEQEQTVVWFTGRKPQTDEPLDFDWCLRCVAVCEHGHEYAAGRRGTPRDAAGVSLIAVRVAARIPPDPDRRRFVPCPVVHSI